MVIGFIIHTLSSDPDIIPNVCYWEPYNFVGKKYKNDDTATNKAEKDSLGYIISRVQAEYIFRKQVTDVNPQEEVKEVKEEQSEHGIFRLTEHSFVWNECRVLWQTSFHCAFVFILSKLENIPLAELVLSHLTRYLANVFNMHEERSRQLIASPEKMAAVTHVLLPAGQLVVMNHRVIKQFEKTLEKILAEKT